ncbi:hypothetical protein [Mycobacterium sp.]|uniref:hypothetical protein n=1 Tax=Mycobacterium sp. TaxID=1785 RepID=UPI003C709B69
MYSGRLQELSRIDSLQHVVILDAEPGDGYRAWSQLDAPAEGYRRPSVDADDVCLLLYTSDTHSNTASHTAVCHPRPFGGLIRSELNIIDNW